MPRTAIRMGVLPLGVFYTCAFLLPQALFLRASLYRPAGPGRFGAGTTLSNYQAALGDPFVRSAIVTTLELSAVVTLVGLALAYPVAYVITRSNSVWSRVLFLAVVASMFTSGVSRALGWRVLLADSGPVNELLLTLRLSAEPLRLVNNFLGVAIGMVHIQVPFLVLGLIPVIEAVPRQAHEAAFGLGASRWRTFWQVTFPLTRVGTVAVSLIVFAASASYFTTPALLGGGHVFVLPILIRQQTLLLFNYAMGATLAAILTVTVFLVVLATMMIARRVRPAASSER